MYKEFRSSRVDGISVSAIVTVIWQKFKQEGIILELKFLIMSSDIRDFKFALKFFLYFNVFNSI
jgi:hypothetical protein